MKLVSVLIVLLLAFSLSLGAALAEDAAVGNPAERVDEITVAGRTCYMFVPQSERIGRFLALTPILVVYGDEAYTAETALAAAHDFGFADIAAREGICVLFANPLEAWDSEADAAAAPDFFAGIYKTYSSLPTLNFVEGVAEKKVNEESDETVKVYPGSLHGLQFFGEGKGADYVAANYLKPNTFGSNYSTQVFEGLSGIPSGVALFSPSKLMENADTSVIPLAIVNGPENAQAVADSFNKDVGVSLVIRNGVKGFDKAAVARVYDAVVDVYYYSQGQFRFFTHYNQNGVKEDNDWITLEDGTAMEYYFYYPETADLTKEDSLPILFWMHGFGGEGEAMLSWSEWPLIGGEEGFGVVSLDQHTQFDGGVLNNMVEKFIAEHPFVDETRLYLGGFSFGSMHTWQMAVANPTRYAAIVPDAGGWMGATEESVAAVPTDVILPTFYIAGGKSPMELPSSEMTQAALAALWKLNGLGEYTYDVALGEWGQPASEVYSVPFKDHSDNVLPDDQRQQHFCISSFVSPDGNTYTYLSIERDKPHTITNNDAHIVWEYIKDFVRNSDGTISVTGK